jgi:hypothetical protein
MATHTYETTPNHPGQKPRRFVVEQKMSEPPLKVNPNTPVRRSTTDCSSGIPHGASILSMKVKRSKG